MTKNDPSVVFAHGVPTSHNEDDHPLRINQQPAETPQKQQQAAQPEASDKPAKQQE